MVSSSGMDIASDDGSRSSYTGWIDIHVHTVTAIVHPPGNEQDILTGRSRKHGDRLVLPGGKIDLGDLREAPDAPWRAAVLREVREETALEPTGLDLIGWASDPERDIRVKTHADLKGALTTPALSVVAGLGLGDLAVRAHYGNPDYVFLCTASREVPGQSAELDDIAYRDRTRLKLEDLAAGHDVIVMWYRYLLAKGLKVLPPQALRCFRAERDWRLE